MPKVLVLGGGGLVGSAIVRRLADVDGHDLYAPPSSELDLLDKVAVDRYFSSLKPDEVYFCAAKVGGIMANKESPVDFFTINTAIGMNVLESSHRYGVNKLLNLGSTCIYPKDCPQPMKEEYLLTGELEPTNEAYALSKIGILRLCEYYRTQYGCNFVSAMPTNAFGPNDNYHPLSAHALPAIIRKVHTAKEEGIGHIDVWGDGTAIREFMYSDDLADALVFIMENYDGKDFLNVGRGEGETIRQIYEAVMEVLGYEGELKFDVTKPTGTPVKVCDVEKINSLGWRARTSLEEGIAKTYDNLRESGFSWNER